jgi:hypothetical protein
MQCFIKFDFIIFSFTGVMDGQFTEPSGVAVGPNNEVIVADTNNHRIQVIFVLLLFIINLFRHSIVMGHLNSNLANAVNVTHNYCIQIGLLRFYFYLFIFNFVITVLQ